MKVVKRKKEQSEPQLQPQPQSENLKSETTSNKIDLKKIEELKVKFDDFKDILDKKEYELTFTKECFDFLTGTFLNKIEWTGGEAYALSEIMKVLYNDNNKPEVSISFKPEVLEAVFHFLKKFTDKGILYVNTFKQTTDKVAEGITKINQDRQELKDISLELVAAENGITVEQALTAIDSYNKQNTCDNESCNCNN